MLAKEKDISYPLVVYGGEPEGVMAAVAAARNGTRTLLIMERNKPGGLMTYGGLNYLDINYGPNGNNLNQGLFTEWHQKVGGKVSFSITKATKAFENMLANEKNLTVYRNCYLIKSNRNGQTLNSIIIKKQNKQINISARRFIDASQNADLAVLSRAPYFTGGADIGLPEQHMAATLVLHIGNINWQGLKKDAIKNKFGPSYINRDHAWGFVKIGEKYQPQNSNIQLRGLNIVLEEDMKINNSFLDAYINAMLIFNVNPLQKNSLNHAYKIGRKEAKHVLSFLRKNLGGFKKAVLLKFPSELYIRESRHIIAEHQLKTDDLFTNRIFEDTIALASYPLDYQASGPDYNGFVLFNPEIYGIPFRTLIPKNLTNMLVVGRSSGYGSLAAASARVLPTGMASGEAAGIAAAFSLKKEYNFKTLSEKKTLIKKIQDKLNLSYDLSKTGKPPVKDKLLLPYLKQLISWRLVIGGYNNQFKLEKIISEKDFAHMIVKGLKQRKAPILYDWVPGSLETLSKKQPLTRNRTAMLLLAATSHRVLEMNKERYFPVATQEKLFPVNITKIISTNRSLTRREAYIIIGNFLSRYPISEQLRQYRGGNRD